jgi:hypothetical protein
MKRTPLILIFCIVLALFLSTSQPARSSALAPAAALPQPTNISCTGYERDTVVVGWKDTATDETNYRVERSISGGAFTEVAIQSPDPSASSTACAAPATIVHRLAGKTSAWQMSAAEARMFT